MTSSKAFQGNYNNINNAAKIFFLQQIYNKANFIAKRDNVCQTSMSYSRRPFKQNSRVYSDQKSEKNKLSINPNLATKEFILNTLL